MRYPILLGVLFLFGSITFGNGGKVITNKYAGTLSDGGVLCRFSIELQPDLFHLLTVGNKYRVIRVKVSNEGNADLELDRQNDLATVKFGGRPVTGLLNLKGIDKEIWDANTFLDDVSRHDVAYPQVVKAGEEQSIFIFIPKADSPVMPDSIEYKIKGRAVVTIEPVKLPSKR